MFCVINFQYSFIKFKFYNILLKKTNDLTIDITNL